jgi:flagellin
MPQVINTNILSLVAQTNLNATQAKENTAVEQLSSGLRINNASDDPAGLAISQRMQAQVNGMNQAVRNANDAVSMSQTADGALGSVSNMLQQMRTLAVQASNGTNGTGDLQNLDAEYQALGSEIQRELSNTQFNGQNILGSGAGTVNYQVGANATDTISVVTTNLTGTSSTAISGATSGALSTAASASAAIGAIDTALNAVNSQRANYGANEIRFQQVVSTLQVNSQNTAAAESQIMDTDYASATSALTQAQIVQQAGTAMLSQANSMPQTVLSLLKNFG